MAFLYEQIAVAGRLQYISHQSLARDFESKQLAVIRLLNLPDDQDVDAQLDFITSALPTFVAGFGGTYPDGSQWIITFERGLACHPKKRENVRGLRRHLDRVLEVNPRLELVQELVLTRKQLRAVYPTFSDRPPSRRDRAEGVGVMADPDTLGFTDLLRGIAVQGCGYSLLDMCRAFPTSCGFPWEDHVCNQDVFTDVFQAWNEQRIAPGDEQVSRASTVPVNDVPPSPQIPRDRPVKLRGPMPPHEELRPSYEAQVGGKLTDVDIEFIWSTGLI